MKASKRTDSATEIDLSELSESLGEADELHPKDKARLVMAYVVLGGVFTLFLAAGAALLLVSVERLERAQQLFDFIKGFGPPLITLVLGFYFRDAAEFKS